MRIWSCHWNQTYEWLIGLSTVWDTASHPGHNFHTKNELTSVFTLLYRWCNTIAKIKSGKEHACGGFEISYKVTIRISIKYKKGAYPKGHKAHDKRTSMTHLSRLTLLLFSKYI